MLQQNLFSFVSALGKAGLKNVVLCPGSRNAPIVLAFVRHGGFNLFSVADERSAAFMAMGMAKSLNKPVAMCCTSGTAALNFYPAICEAYYSGIPLLAITADRPPEMIDQWDGQAIRQKEVFKNHILLSVETPDADELQLNRFAEIAIETFTIANTKSKGPVHINIPLNEPLYKGLDEQFGEYPSPDYQVSFKEGQYPFSNKYPEIHLEQATSTIKNNSRILVIAGADTKIAFEKYANLIVLPDVISGLSHAKNLHWGFEKGLVTANKEILSNLKPDVLITTGKWILSKNLKNLIRNQRPPTHIHLDSNGQCADPFGTMPQLLKNSFDELLNWANQNSNATYIAEWQNLTQNANTKSDSWIGSDEMSEIRAFKKAIKSQTSDVVVHFSNSMPIRYASIFSDLLETEHIYANRGTSGIDGCSSTALGHALVTDKKVVLFTGDISFFYDSNAWWNNHLPDNLKIILFNNRSGNIFNIIDGASKMDERHPFMTTPHFRSAKNICHDAGINYLASHNFDSLKRNLYELNISSKITLLEIITNSETDSKEFASFLHFLNHKQ